ncbi:hypothetical protein [Burkholderia vietnamiensis]|uniref:hypothetical protein n=1 Tax=Burkholderia vietnamiensis TaxID=60552 RepID=UPI00352CA619
MSELKPCEIPCPKCGSEDIMRNFWRAGERRQALEYDKQTMGKYASVTSWYAIADRDHIGHLCRCCQFVWQTLPMKKRRAPASEGGRIRCPKRECQFKVARIGELGTICPADRCGMLIVARESES